MKGINPNTGELRDDARFLLDEMLARLKEAKLIGVDAIEFDDVDGWQSNNGLVDHARPHSCSTTPRWRTSPTGWASRSG